MVALSAYDRKCLKETVFFGALPVAVLDLVVSQSHIAVYRQGCAIFHQGQKAEAIFCVADGLVKLSVASKDGEDVVVELLQKGASFAEALAFRDEAYPVTATAVVESRILVVPKSAVQSALVANPDAFPALLTAAYTHLHRLIQQVEQLKAVSGVERVAGFILALAERDPDSATLRIPCEKQVLASMLGIKPETLSRAFKRLEQHGLRVRGPVIEITSRAALENFLEVS